MPEWLSPILTFIAGGVGTGVLSFLLKRRSQTDEQWQKMVAAQALTIASQGDRISKLETRIEELHRENAECLKVQASLRAEIALLKPPKES